MFRKIYYNIFTFCLLCFFLFSCQSKPESITTSEENLVESPVENILPPPQEIEVKNPEITLLFAGDIMAHNINYAISDVNKIYRDVKDVILPCDLAFANIEAPIDTTQEAQTYPNFNMTQEYVQAAIDAGFNVFSLANNHTNDQYLQGILETTKTTDRLTKIANEKGQAIYFSGIKASKEAEFSYNIINYEDWKILFLPITEILNRPHHKELINYLEPTSNQRNNFLTFVKELKEKNECDLFILSVHAAEAEYTRLVKDSQEKFYQDLLEAGVDIVWANHAHIIKNRKYIFDSESGRQKVIMYANGNTISGQRTKPDFTNKNPIGERDNTGDGVMVKITMVKNDDNIPQIKKAENIFITTYINTAWEYVIKKLDNDFVEYLYDVPRNNWAEYIKRRIKINKEYTKDIIEWQ